MDKNRAVVPFYFSRAFKIIGLFPVLLASCVYHYEYPSWAGLISIVNNRCPDISGTYTNEGGMPGGRLPRFTRLLFPNEPVFATHVQITQLDDTLEIFVWDEQKLAHKKSLMQ